MDATVTKFFHVVKSKDSLLYIILMIAFVSLVGWLSGKMGLASYSLKYIPIAPANVLILITLIITFLFKQRYERSRLLSIVTTYVSLLVAIICSVILLPYIFKFSWDIETIFVRNPNRFGNVVTGRISPISSLLYIFLSIGILGVNHKNSKFSMYLGGTFTLLVFIISSILLIGYLYRAPLLYGSKVIPVSLPSAICFFLFSLTFARIYGSEFWTFNLIKSNKVTLLLLKSFLPIVVVISILQGFLDTVWSFNDKNPPLTGAFILLIVISVTTFIIYRVSTIIGSQLSSAERQLKESEEKFRSIMEHSADAIFITNQEGRYIYTNKSASDILGYTSEELKRKSFADISPPEKVAEYFEVFNQILNNKGKILTEIELLKKDGDYIATDLNVVMLPDGTVYGSCRDITQRKLSEHILNELNKKLSELNADKDRFIGILGHDLKSPFNNLLGLSEVLLEDIHNLDFKQIEEISSTINATARSTYNLLEEILLWARTQQGKIAFNPQLLSFRKVCMETLEILNATAQKKDIAINYQVHDDLLVFADPDMLKTIMRNLISNSIKFTAEHGKINIKAEKISDSVNISVSDNGIGIDPQILSKLFDLTEVITTKGTAGETGTGLGLLLCKGFVEKHGGRIWAESEVGRGSEFKFKL
ncbi:MAG TPA: ATP-binding protein [Bacteroidales bacterium]|nr:ATP-binding protein [Bacteroidales bacterium]